MKRLEQLWHTRGQAQAADELQPRHALEGGEDRRPVDSAARDLPVAARARRQGEIEPGRGEERHLRPELLVVERRQPLLHVLAILKPHHPKIVPKDGAQLQIMPGKGRPIMDLPLRDALRTAFARATLRREAEMIREPRFWQALTRLQERCNAARGRENDLFAARHAERVAATRRRLIDEAGRKDVDLKPRFAGIDRLSPEATLRDARRLVRDAHQRRLDRIDDFEHRTLDRLVRRAQEAEMVREHACAAFLRAADRRTGPQRRRDRMH